jgi:hypothetical protein
LSASTKGKNLGKERINLNCFEHILTDSALFRERSEIIKYKDDSEDEDMEFEEIHPEDIEIIPSLLISDYLSMKERVTGFNKNLEIFIQNTLSAYPEVECSSM